MPDLVDFDGDWQARIAGFVYDNRKYALTPAKTMKLLLITASAPEIHRIRRSRFLNFQQITMPYLAALTPPHWQVSHVDEEVSRVDFNGEVDLVGITFHTPSALHAYEIADRFRGRGIPVVLG